MTLTQLDALRAELQNDPLGRGYVGQTAAQIVASLNATNRSAAKAVMSGDEVFQQTVAGEFVGLTAAKQQMWVSFCARAAIDPMAAANESFAAFIFGAGSETLAKLKAARVRVISRADELGLWIVTEGQIDAALGGTA